MFSGLRSKNFVFLPSSSASASSATFKKTCNSKETNSQQRLEPGESRVFEVTNSKPGNSVAINILTSVDVFNIMYLKVNLASDILGVRKLVIYWIVRLALHEI